MEIGKMWEEFAGIFMFKTDQSGLHLCRLEGYGTSNRMKSIPNPPRSGSGPIPLESDRNKR